MRGFFGGGARREAELEEEIRSHLRLAVEERVARGETEEEAERAVRREFGNEGRVKEVTREMWGGMWLERLLQDVRYALRSLRRAPAFTAAVVGTLALGIGATSAVFAVVDGVLLRPLPFAAPDRLVTVSYWRPPEPSMPSSGLVDAHYLALRERGGPFEGLATFSTTTMTLTGAGDPARLAGSMVTPGLFGLLGVRPALGRGLLSGEARTGAEPVVVLSNGLWRSRFGADPGMVGKRVRIDGEERTVVGVMPEGFDFPNASALWMPLEVKVDPHQGFIRPVVARLRGGVGLREAQRDFAGIARELPAADRRGFTAEVRPLRDLLVGSMRGSLLVFAGAVAFVLLIACGNVANLLLLRATGRTEEVAIRSALGASRLRLVRQIATESVVLALLGGVAGAGLAFVIVRALLALAPEGRIPRADSVHVDPTVLAFTLLVACVLGVALGLAPALQATRRERRGVPAAGARGAAPGRGRLRGALVVAEIAFALVLLTGAGLMLRSFRNMRAVELGFRPTHVLTATMDLPEADYPDAGRMRALWRSVLEGLEGRPGVEAAGLVNWRPLGKAKISGDFQVPGGEVPPGAAWADKVVVSPGYFRAMGVRLLRGREFDRRDDERSTRVVIVSHRVAERIWPGRDPLGKRISMKDDPGPDDWLTVVGEVDDVLQDAVTTARGATLYQPYAQVDASFFLSHLSVVVRSAAEPAAVAAAMRRAVHAADPNLALQGPTRMTEVVDADTAEPLFQARLLSAFSVLGLLLSAVGVYGLLAYEVAQRRREIGIRMALGARERRVVAWVLRRTLGMSGLGVLLGAAGAVALTRVLKGFLFGVTPTDPLTFGAVAALLVLTGLVAGSLPARRAARVDPAAVLRAE